MRSGDGAARRGPGRRSSSAPSPTFMSEARQLRNGSQPLKCLLPLKTEEMPGAVTCEVRKPIGSLDMAWPGPVLVADTAKTPRPPHHSPTHDAAAPPLRHLAPCRNARTVFCRDDTVDEDAILLNRSAVGATHPCPVFDSRFESGNLNRACAMGPTEFELYLDCDVDTASHTQWFFFSVSNLRAGVPYQFHIMNLLKASSLYNHGMNILYHVQHPPPSPDAPKRKRRTSGTATALPAGPPPPGSGGWRRGGSRISYYSNNVHNPASPAAAYYTLSFELVFTAEEVGGVPGEDPACGGGGVVHLAHSHPYTYTDLRNYIGELEKREGVRRFCKRKVMWHTVAGNPVDVLSITGFAPTPELLQQRKGVVLTGRVHPGEASASWIMKGMIDFLVSDDPKAVHLRDKLVIRIVPMLNPDGVVHGNSRCSLSGHDLNRRWGAPSASIHPEVHHAKKMLHNLAQEREVILFCDVHGHSRKPGVFMYGCGGTEERIFPKIMSVVSPLFSYTSCSFNVTADKRNTARVVGFRELGIANSYTLEASVGGSSLEHYTTHDLETTGLQFCHSLLHYLDPATCSEMLRDLRAHADATDCDDVGSDDSADDETDLRAADAAGAPGRDPTPPDSTPPGPLHTGRGGGGVGPWSPPAQSRADPSPRAYRTGSGPQPQRSPLSPRLPVPPRAPLPPAQVLSRTLSIDERAEDEWNTVSGAATDALMPIGRGRRARRRRSGTRGRSRRRERSDGD